MNWRDPDLESPTRKAQDLFRGALEAAPNGILAVDAGGRILLANRHLEQLLGYPPGELIGQPIENLVPHGIRQGHIELRTRFMANPSARAMGAGRDLRAIRKDGTEIPVEIGLSPVAIGGQPMVVASIVDVSERNRAEELFRLAVEGSPSGLLAVDEDGRIILANQQLGRLLGYGADELLGSPVERLVPGTIQGDHLAHRRRYFAAPTARAMGVGRDLRAIRKDGTEIPVEIGLSPLSIGGKHMVVASLVDVTERKAAERAVKEAYATLEHTVELRTAALKRSNEDLERFASIAAHDLQEPLRMIASYTQLLADDYSGRLDADADQYIRFAVDGAKRMQRLLHDLLAYSRITARGGTFEDMNVDDALDEALANLRLPIQESGATLTRERLPRVRADRPQIAQLFQNLIANAIKFAGDGPPRIEIVAAAEDRDLVRITVRDHGIGFDMKHAERVFSIFQRLHTSRELAGSGVGLAIVKRIVDRHGGRVWAEAAPGAGASFHFTLPAEHTEV